MTFCSVVKSAETVVEGVVSPRTQIPTAPCHGQWLPSATKSGKEHMNLRGFLEPCRPTQGKSLVKIGKKYTYFMLVHRRLKLSPSNMSVAIVFSSTVLFVRLFSNIGAL